MENNIFSIPPMASKYVLRSTGEEVEVVAFDQKENGERGDEDWVTYIDSEGKEHIKEHLNIQLDFKAVVTDVWNTIAEIGKGHKTPTTRNSRIFEVAKELYLADRGYGVNEAVNVATSLVDKVGIETE